MSCDGLNIPERLYRNNQEPNSLFEQNEDLFRRFPPDPYKLLPNDEISISNISLIDRVLELSVNRDLYCEDARDCLYNVKTGDHYYSYGIISFKVETIESYEILHPEHPKRNWVYKFRLVHKPHECMYPHSEVEVIRTTDDESEIKDIPKSKFLEFHNHIRKNCIIEKFPD